MITIYGTISILPIGRIDTKGCQVCSNVIRNRTQDLPKPMALTKRALDGSALTLPEDAAVKGSTVDTTTGCQTMRTAWWRMTTCATYSGGLGMLPTKII